MEDRQMEDRLSRVEVQLEKMAALIHDSFRTMSSALELQGRVVDDRLSRLETVVKNLADAQVEQHARHAELERQMARDRAETEQTLREMQRAILELARRVPPYPDTNGSGPVN